MGNPDASWNADRSVAGIRNNTCGRGPYSRTLLDSGIYRIDGDSSYRKSIPLLRYEWAEEYPFMVVMDAHL
jgi:hypothetical protein